MRVIRMFLRTFKESFKNMFRHGWLSISAILSITVTLLLTSMLVIITMNIQNATKVVAQGLKMNVYLNYDVVEDEAKKITKDISAFNNIKNIEYSNETQQWQKLMDSFTEEEREMFKDYEQSKPLYKTITITLNNPEDSNTVKAEIEKNYKSKINKIDFPREMAESILPLFETIRRAGYFLILSVGFVAMILISNTIRITIVARKIEIGIMRLVAASNWYIRTPFIIEGILLGIIGALIATALSVGLYWYYLPVIASKLVFGTSEIIVPVRVVLQESLLWTVSIGSFIGLLGSLLPVRKYLRK